ncbi:rhamnogalacturonan acetylesterase [Pedobacter sp. AW31-3R]|uniref:rhamnogalacturonan acetylesterase n=1 Tax=Pedobacter sp. AW31-3R TaxID=3445781 RepID=UPI003FA0F547
MKFCNDITMGILYQQKRFFAFLVVYVLSIWPVHKGWAQQQQRHKFDFGSGRLLKGHVRVLSTDVYSRDSGYGFDFPGYSSGKAFYFSLALPEGNYRVTVTLGDTRRSSLNTVKAESRRLMCEKVKTRAGQSVKKTFIVNLKSRIIDSQDTVSLKTRELTKLDWDDRLTLEFNEGSALRALEISRADDQVTVFLAGNSTVVNQEDEPWASWGQMIPRFFKPGVAIANHAESGLTLGSFLAGKRLKKILQVMKKGDYLFIEFGHNDQKEKGPGDGAYGSYTKRLKFFVDEVRKKGGIPVILSSTTRRSIGEDGLIVNSLGDFPDAARKVAVTEKVALIDLNRMTTEMFNAMGAEGSKNAFVHYPANSYPQQDKALADNTHFNPYGAYEIARCVVSGIKTEGLGIARYLVDDLPAFDPRKPDPLKDWSWPESPKNTSVKPDGN